ncbi:MAG: aspartate kinase [Candidatus Latescibacteria bacterium]|jgi:aspartate kinase|nr:aspartate kinase [Gemmatimonadaceae bacterium]MDP6014975.1 aspartate kinase [Candidatus Latescibacterota bacterium]MDP7449536.1 aspartate kinase [Candidatus Latescibacterota bacterium]HJP33515.1 aspartate kinase [Candidatus Latescibacterota bacterium]
MKTVKFGGSSLASAEQVRKVCDIVTADPARRLVVVSAPGKRQDGDTKVTDLLIAAAEARLTHRTGDDELGHVVDRFTEIAIGLGLAEDAVAPICADLQRRLAAETGDAGLYMDTMKAAGEANCAHLVAHYLREQGFDAQSIDPAEAGMILSDEPGNARVLQQAYGRLRGLRDRPGVSIFPGFFGYGESGRLVTFPRGGSDITGAILAAAVDAELYENFTDVDSVFVANPRLIDRPRAVAEITYREMRELSYAGFSVFHDEALEPVFHAGIPVAVKNTNNPAADGTRIVPKRQVGDVPIVGIAGTAGFCSIYVSRYLMNREVGFGRRLLQLFEDEGIPFEHTPSGIDNLSVIVREDIFDHATEERVLRRIRTELAADEVSVERGLALIMVVGEGMRHTVGLAAKATSAFADAKVNLEMINQGSSEVSMMFGVKDHDVDAAVQSLYAEFFS